MLLSVLVCVVLTARVLALLGAIFRCQDIQERRKKSLETLWQRMEDVICLLWPDTLIFPYGSYAVPGMMTPDSDVDVMVSLHVCRTCPIFHTHFRQPDFFGFRLSQCCRRNETVFVLYDPGVDTSKLLLCSALLSSLLLFNRYNTDDAHAASPFGMYGAQVLPGDQRECRASRSSAEMADGQPRRRGSRTDSAGGTLSKIHELADHLQKHVRIASDFP